ncbi:MlaD family protein [Mycobacterium marseillense]|uniref:MlaD family protein n=1 Tax=Mycobacterium marseillense TaxID=701042 RepID=UPI0011A9DA2A|nr:MlaD family protein [Mycobacterium marseillense]
MSLLRGSDEDQARIRARIGAIAILIVVVGVTVNFAVKPFARTKNVISVAIETPYVGQGVVGGTPVIMHGVKVGEVTAISSVPGGRVRLNADLQSGPTTGLTDAMGIDFRPSNYFGVTGIDLTPADGGQPLRSGAQISVIPKGNFALQALLYRLGELSNQVVTDQLVHVVERATRYTDALNPLLETMIIVTTTTANVQKVSTAQLLRNTTGINVAFPGIVDALINTGDMWVRSDMGTGFNADRAVKENPFVSTYDTALGNYYNDSIHLMQSDPDKFVFGRWGEWLVGAKTDLFGPVGHLLSSHVYELFPVVDSIRALTDVVPKLVPPTNIADTLRELRTRLERMYTGSGEERALQARVILDEIPSVAAPIGLALGAAQ